MTFKMKNLILLLSLTLLVVPNVSIGNRFILTSQMWTPATNSPTLSSYGISLFEIGSLMVVLAVIVVLGVSYQAYAKKPKDADNSQSFYQYLRNRFHYREKMQQKYTGSETDKALETIEEIIDESTDNTE